MVSLSDLADALRGLLFLAALVWLLYAWLHRVSYRRAVAGLVLLVGADWLAHAAADFAERPNSGLPSDFPLYTVVMVAAAGAGLLAGALYARGRGPGAGVLLDGALIVLVAGALGGRAYHVWMHLDYYAENRDAVTDFAQGGLGLAGALLAGLAALWLYARVRRVSFGRLADAAAAGLALAESIGWYGAALTHTPYGLALEGTPVNATVSGQAGAFEPLAASVRALVYPIAQDLPDAYGIIALRAPVQMLACLVFAALFVLLLARGLRQRPAGDGFLVYWILAGAAALLLGFLRGDETLVWNGLRMEQWFGLAMLLSGAAVAIGMSARRPRVAPPPGHAARTAPPL